MRPTLTILEGGCLLAEVNHWWMEAALGKRSNPYARRAFYMESDNDYLLSAWISVRREIVRIEKAIKAGKVDYHPNLVPNLNWERFDVVMHTEELPKSEWYDSIVRVSFSEWAENEGLLPKDDTAVGPSQPQDEAAATAGATKERGNDLAIMGALVRITLGEESRRQDFPSQTKL